ncbi:MAG: polymerase [Clostridiaceae bacterium]|jgi:poly [ADP-ribose] polymerase|nr:polymerase [Clostridiaceae bacterium]
MANVIRIGSVDEPLFQNFSVLQKEILNMASISEHSNKFYIIELQSGTGQYPYRIFTEYGRVGGRTPRKEGRYYTSRYLAEDEYRGIMKEKENKGYRKVDVADNYSFSAKAVKVSTKNKAEDLSKITDKVLRLIGKLYSSATDYLVKSIDTPLGKLSTSQVAEGIEILNTIESLLDSGRTGSILESYTNDFYSVIPVVFGTGNIDYKSFIIDNYNKLNRNKDLLGVMSSIVKAHDSLEKSIQDKYNSLNIKLIALSSRTKAYKDLVNWVNTTRGHNHHFGFDIKDIYEFKDMVGYDKFNPYNVTTSTLFHGTRNENMLSIMQSGLKIKPASAVHTGSLFGTGIYFADCSTKSGNYANGFGTASNAGLDTNFMFVCEVATGKIKEYEDGQPQLTHAPRGYNSVMGKKGRTLVHNEYIVYNESQVKIKYIIEFKRV